MRHRARCIRRPLNVWTQDTQAERSGKYQHMYMCAGDGVQFFFFSYVHAQHLRILNYSAELITGRPTCKSYIIMIFRLFMCIVSVLSAYVIYQWPWDTIHNVYDCHRLHFRMNHYITIIISRRIGNMER